MPYSKLSLIQGDKVTPIVWPSVSAASAQLRRRPLGGVRSPLRSDAERLYRTARSRRR